MIEFIVGLALGAILGVVFDRLWTRVEKVARVEISGGYFQNIDGQEGFTFTIKNLGTTEIPEYRLGIQSHR